MQDGRKAVWSIPYVSVVFFPSLKQNFLAYRSSKVSSRPNCIFEIHQLRQSGFSRVYSNCCCRCSFESEIIKIGLSSHKSYSNNIVNFEESTTIVNACTKTSGNLFNTSRSVRALVVMCLRSSRSFLDKNRLSVSSLGCKAPCVLIINFLDQFVWVPLLSIKQTSPDNIKHKYSVCTSACLYT